MTPRFVFRPAARADLREAHHWYETQQHELGDTLVGVVTDTLERIAAHPQMYPLAEGAVRRAVLARYPYGLFYRELGETIEILALLHHRRDPRIWRRRAGRKSP